MSIRAMTWAWSLEELPLKESMVLLALADQANDEGLCWPSQETLAKKSRGSVRSVKRAIKFLRDAGLVETIIRATPAGRKSNYYRVMVGAEFSASGQQRANLALCEEPVDNAIGRETVGVVDNPENPRQDCKGPNWPFAASETQGATGGTSQGATGGPLDPYRDLEPKEEPPTNQPGPESAMVSVNEERSEDVGVRRVPASRADVEHEVDWGLLGECLPRPWLGLLTVSAAERLARLLRRALDAGWTRPRIYRILNDSPLPADTRNLVGLVIHRVGEIARTSPTPARKPPAEPATARAASAEAATPAQIDEIVARLEANTTLRPEMRQAMINRLTQVRQENTA